MKLSPHLLIPALFLFIVSGFIACNHKRPQVVIAISKATPNYVKWLKRADSLVQTVSLYSLPVDSALAVLDRCNGLLLTGGEDVYPGIYGRENDTARCDSFDHYRDTLEINLILRALERRMPVFGVCRGEHILNAVFGGEQFIDLPHDFDTSVLHRCTDYLTCFHTIYVERNSLLHSICLCDSSQVTSNHHQGIRVLAPGLKANSFAPDGLMEGIELEEPEGESFLLAVQWHPERMEAGNPLSGPLAIEFIRQCRKFSQSGW
jgi:putative glutamine amidotransferase